MEYISFVVITQCHNSENGPKFGTLFILMLFYYGFSFILDLSFEEKHEQYSL